jgi:hypothetical protein
MGEKKRLEKWNNGMLEYWVKRKNRGNVKKGCFVSV